MKQCAVWIVAQVVMALVCWRGAAADEALLDRLVDENTYDLKGDDEKVGGSGLTFLLEATADAQFFCFAEPHNVNLVPPIFTGLFEALQRQHGFHYVALETGPVVLERADREPARGDRQAIDRLFGAYPKSFHFYTDEELQMIADVGRLSTAENAPLWGVDQVHGTRMVLEELKEATSDEAARAKIEELIGEVRQFERQRGRKHNFLKQDHDAFEHLRESLEPQTASREEFLVDQLRVSWRIYRDYFRAQEGEPTAYASNCRREENMKSLFMHYYRGAQAAGEALPKVMLKSGHWHLMKGASPGNCYTLGTFVMDLAKSNGMSSFHLMVSVVNEGKDASSITKYPEYAPITRAGSTDRWVVVDLRPLRGYLYAGKLGEMHADLRHWIYSYDAVLMIGGTTGGHYVTDVKRRFGKL